MTKLLSKTVSNIPLGTKRASQVSFPWFFERILGAHNGLVAGSEAYDARFPTANIQAAIR
jgi:hypothetical protein